LDRFVVISGCSGGGISTLFAELGRRGYAVVDEPGPPWPEIYVQDAERRHGLDSAISEYSRLLGVYQSLGYQLSILPKASVAQRADFVLAMLVE
jgi:predicted ATPase